MADTALRNSQQSGQPGQPAGHTGHTDHAGHAQHSNPWPFVVGVGLTTAFLGVIPLIYGLPPGWILEVVGIFAFIVGLLMWLINLQQENMQVVAGTRIDSMDKKTPLWAIGFVILSELFLFGALFACYFYLHDLDYQKTGSMLNFFVVHGGEVFQVMGPLVVMNTVLLITSSITLQIGEFFLKKDRLVPFRVLLAVTVVLGLIFLGGQIAEYAEFAEHEFFITSGPFGTLFYAITGLHGLHVAAGTLLLIYLLIGSFRGQFSSKHHKAVTTVGIYWHFVDLVWIFLVLVLYLRLL